MRIRLIVAVAVVTIVVKSRRLGGGGGGEAVQTVKTKTYLASMAVVG